MQNFFYIVVVVSIVVMVVWTSVLKVRKRDEIQRWLSEISMEKIKFRDLDPEVQSLLDKRFPKVLAEGVYVDRMCVVALKEAASSDGEDSNTVVLTVAIQSAVQWPRITVQPDQSAKKISRKRVRSGDSTIDKHWYITSENESAAKTLIRAMDEELQRVPKVMKSFRLSSGKDTDKHTRWELGGHWIAMAKQIDGYHTDAIEEMLDSIVSWAIRIEQSVDSEKAEL